MAVVLAYTAENTLGLVIVKVLSLVYVATLCALALAHYVLSGYRTFSLGALAHAPIYYRGYKYSDTEELAVVLCRLGYRVRNDIVLPVPVYRSRTRMYDVFVDLGA